MRLTSRGQVYIGLIIGIGILFILTGAIASLTFTSYDILNFTQARTTAKHLALEQIELIRNLPYDDIGTIGGIPQGVIPQTQSARKNGLDYTLTTTVIYIDDPFDQLAPTDTLPTDYKRIRVDVSWGGLSASRTNPITMITDASPRGLETSAGGGTLSILVFDSNSLPIGQATVTIVSSGINPPVNLTVQTGNDGRVILPGTPICNNCYRITATKNSYSTERTYASSEIANPSKPDATVLEEQVTQLSFAIDLLSTLTIRSTSTRESGFAPLGGQSFSLRGDKIIGTTNQDVPVYKYDQSLSTNSSGELVINNLEWDNYHFTNQSSSFDLAGTNSLLPIEVISNSNLTFSYSLNPDSQHSLLTIFKEASGSAIASVSARLFTGTEEASSSSGLTTDPDFGQIFFPSLSASTYTLEASASGYAPFSKDIVVNGDDTETVILQTQ